MRPTVRATWMAALTLQAVACRTPTEATIDISTDVPCATVIGTSITTFLDGQPTSIPTTVTSMCDGTTGEIGTLVLTPGHAKTGIVVETILSTSVDPTTCVEGMAGCSYQRRLLDYVSNVDLHIPIVHPAVCAGLVCPQDRTCIKNPATGAAGCESFILACTRAICELGGAAADGGITSPTGEDAGADTGAITDAGHGDAFADGAMDSASDAGDATLDSSVADGSAVDGGSPSDAHRESGGDSTTGPADSCEPKTCSELGVTCGSTEDGCGNILICTDCDTFTPCSPGTCPGCCSSPSNCEVGDLQGMCGAHGVTCIQCQGPETCVEGQGCVEGSDGSTLDGSSSSPDGGQPLEGGLCGAADEACCTGGECQASLTCLTDMCVPCGQRNQPCCNGSCNVGICMAGTCVLGGMILDGASPDGNGPDAPM